MSIDPNMERRGFLKCMTWAGTAMVWTVAGGVPRSRLIGSAEAATSDFTFVQISDSHLGFDKPANPNVTATLQEALDDVGKLPKRPAFMIHTGDITHLSKPAQFDTAAQLCGGTKLTMHTVPGEHDILEEEGKSYLNRFGKGTKGDGWYSFNADGVHFIPGGWDAFDKVEFLLPGIVLGIIRNHLKRALEHHKQGQLLRARSETHGHELARFKCLQVRIAEGTGRVVHWTA